MNLSKAAGNSLWILAASGVNKVSSIVLLVVLTRALGAEGFGSFSYALFFVLFFSSLTELGLTPVLIRYVNASGGRADSSKAQGVGLAIGLVSTGVAILLACVGATLFGLDPDIRLLICIASASLLISFRDITFRWILEVPFRASLKMRTPALIGIGSELIGLLLVIVAVSHSSSVAVILALYVVSNLPGFILLAVLSFKEIVPTLAPGGVGPVEVLREAAPIAASNFMITVYLAVGALMLFRYSGAESLAYYALAFRLTTSLRVIPEAIGHSLLPLMATAHAEDGGMERVAALFGRAIKYVSLAAFPLALGTMAVAPNVATLVGGESFSPASLALAVLIWATFFAFFNTVLRFTFNAVAFQRLSFWLYLVVALSTVLLSALLIPRWGLAGACAALALSEALGLVVGAVMGARVGLGVRPGVMAGEMVRVAAASVVMAGVVWYLPNLLLQVIVGIIAYTFFVLLFGGVSRRELFGWLRLG
ncbi:MAG: flippase [Proteobacteria bacterium]|nr:flippase [Pseudomonadota bacterium]